VVKVLDEGEDVRCFLLLVSLAPPLMKQFVEPNRLKECRVDASQLAGDVWREMKV